jgi:proteic killer suppression protein
LKRLFEKDDPSGIRPDLLDTVQEILTLLDDAAIPQESGLPGYRLHPLKGDLKGFGRLACDQTANHISL